MLALKQEKGFSSSLTGQPKLPDNEQVNHFFCSKSPLSYILIYLYFLAA
jgi:hypothetical protein